MEKNPSGSIKHHSNQGLAQLREACGMRAEGASKGKVNCLKCGTSFLSQDKTKIRICNHCKTGDTWKTSHESDTRYPAISAKLDFGRKGRGKQSPKCATDNARRVRAHFKKKVVRTR